MHTPLPPYSTEHHSTSQRKESENEISDVHCMPSRIASQKEKKSK